MLGYMLDMLLDILDKNPDYRHFHLDSQTMPIQDYLEVYPEKKEKLKNPFYRVLSFNFCPCYANSVKFLYFSKLLPYLVLAFAAPALFTYLSFLQARP